MAKKQKALNSLKNVMDEGSWGWLFTKDEYLANAVREAVDQGASPVEIRQFIEQNYGQERLALMCQAAARHLVRETE